MGTGINRAVSQFGKQTTRLILCTDNDREGEHIAWECCEIFSKQRPVNIYPARLPAVVSSEYNKNIVSNHTTTQNNVPAARMRFSSLTKQVLLNALEHTEALNANIIESVDTRL